jgi:MFS family permease
LPLAFIIIGDIFTFEQRARMQGFFSGVWGISSIIGPVLGGFLVDQASWRWVFFINVIPGVVAFALVWLALQEPVKRKKSVSIDYAGAILLMAAVVLLLLGVNDLSTMLGIALFVGSVALFAALWFVEVHAGDALLPLALFRDRLFVVATLHGLLAGWAMFGSLSYVPLYVQSVMGTSATEAGTAITPMMLGWVLASVVGGRLLLRIGYRTVAVSGMVLLTIGAFLMAQTNVDTSLVVVMSYLCIMGIGMGLSVPSFLIAVQSSVTKRNLGAATSTLQFSRSIGGTLGVSVMGAYLTMQLTKSLLASGLDPNSVSLDNLIAGVGNVAANVIGPLREAMAVAMEGVFMLAFIASAFGLLATLFAPAGQIDQVDVEEEDGEAVIDFAPEL